MPSSFLILLPDSVLPASHPTEGATFMLLTRAVSTRAAEPEKQFALLTEHVHKLQSFHDLSFSEIVIMVERNLGL